LGEVWIRTVSGDVIKVNKSLPLSTADSSLGEKCMEFIYLAVE
jgi:hypothetical protein